MSIGLSATSIEPERPDAVLVTTTVTTPGRMGVTSPVSVANTAILVSVGGVPSFTTLGVEVSNVTPEPPAARADRLFPVTVTLGPNTVLVTVKVSLAGAGTVSMGEAQPTIMANRPAIRAKSSLFFILNLLQAFEAFYE
jgi:hypothetical protein